jgi:hypothetical protein
MPATRGDDQAKRHRLGLAAAQGDADAQCTLGVMHDRGEGGPVTSRGMPTRRLTLSRASTSGAMSAGYLPRPTPSYKNYGSGAMRATTPTMGSGSARGHLASRRPWITWQRSGAPSTAYAHDRLGPRTNLGTVQ